MSKLHHFRILALALCGTSGAASANAVCGTGANANICLASIDARGKLTPDQRQRLADVGTRAIDVINSPEFERDLAAFVLAYDWRSKGALHKSYWEGFDAKAATASTRAAFKGLHVETKGGLGGWFGAKIFGNVAYEGGTRSDGSREILLNRNRLDRPLSGLVATYVHEAGHKAGYSHRGKQNALQKCEPPYVMGQIALKLSDPRGWTDFLKSPDACSFWK